MRPAGPVRREKSAILDIRHILAPWGPRPRSEIPFLLSVKIVPSATVHKNATQTYSGRGGTIARGWSNAQKVAKVACAHAHARNVQVLILLCWTGTVLPVSKVDQEGDDHWVEAATRAHKTVTGVVHAGLWVTRRDAGRSRARLLMSAG